MNRANAVVMHRCLALKSFSLARRVVALCLVGAGFIVAVPAVGQFVLQDSNTSASLRGIASPGNGVAWASGTNGTVVRTEDGGFVWQGCAVPPGAEALDFRGVQAFDGQTALAMSSGKGALSRVYETVDGCRTWTLVFTNPDAEGFWDAIVVKDGRALLIGDPVHGRFQLYSSSDSAFKQWSRFGEVSSLYEFRFDLSPVEGETLFAASNSALFWDPASHVGFVSGGKSGSFFSVASWQKRGFGGFPTYSSYKSALPLAKGESAGAFSLYGRIEGPSQHFRTHFVAVGGDFAKADSSASSAAWSKDAGLHWKSAKTPPHGYRSSVAYDPSTKTWITVGPNGTDVSRDDGRNWVALRPGVGDAADADRQWNALALPFVVGPHGRIGRLRDGVLATVGGGK